MKTEASSKTHGVKRIRFYWIITAVVAVVGTCLLRGPVQRWYQFNRALNQISSGQLKDAMLALDELQEQDRQRNRFDPTIVSAKNIVRAAADGRSDDPIFSTSHIDRQNDTFVLEDVQFGEQKQTDSVFQLLLETFIRSSSNEGYELAKRGRYDEAFDRLRPLKWGHISISEFAELGLNRAAEAKKQGNPKKEFTCLWDALDFEWPDKRLVSRLVSLVREQQAVKDMLEEKIAAFRRSKSYVPTIALAIAEEARGQPVVETNE